MFQNIVIAYDESKEAAHALDSAISLAKCMQAKLKIVTVVEALPGYTNMAAIVAPQVPQELMDERREMLQALQASALKRAADLGVAADAILIDGEEVESIIDAATRGKADLLILGLRRHHLLSLFGGTAHRVAEHSPCAILAVS